ncbi:MAG: hypothetical protein UX99_C0003G0062 [Candidatus Amesbacteria bacterium GW2011_GWB1_47_26]|uniref:HEPN domain-containing protein n=1 Tax=Candidatus Amesbacteria bacterium GW2011_GWC2_45_19 TaxID=1618366 RepID=A0A0G1PCT4_9BACT|nr:MAG: hypothetical protein UX05_C0003G0062 [Candidatus Amesbacteria bacterium GW2011_GWC2_45_19]KKU38682.1 MAG: hypothetical protein UX52_C0002G0062 [Candidatus Amesbacteria bacterium GW2011_GWA1_46_35]KKU68614.1 MAG: hypothetical protein UX93_C0006G0031 [Microgenomates group bacterium GW2011_GWC1_47_20]KKU75002.1 MAG: hypothetical protein UX99_C0003G0062 [Candidatus Amesbacteria bacterium GW2011_GWB1_47_26]KKU79791.1 MAG: hypothetical protein UY06_C0013G0005 [Candidatus Amesbacteria bacteriu
MTKKFCSICKEEKEVVKSSPIDKGVRSLLSCGHNFIEINLKETIKVSEMIGLRKTGGTHEKYKRGDKPPNINYANKFIEYGDIDYEAAVILFNIQDRDYDFMNQAAFLCAQAVEKYLKAFLFWNAPQHYPSLSGKQVLVEFRKLSHDLIKILNECVKDNKNFNSFRTQLEAINKYSLLKYPDVEDEMVYSSDGLSISSELSKDVKQISDFVKGVIV